MVNKAEEWLSYNREEMRDNCPELMPDNMTAIVPCVIEEIFKEYLGGVLE